MVQGEQQLDDRQMCQVESVSQPFVGSARCTGTPGAPVGRDLPLGETVWASTNPHCKRATRSLTLSHTHTNQ